MDSIAIQARPCVEGPLFATGFSLTHPLYASNPYEWVGMGLLSGLGIACVAEYGIVPARLVQKAISEILEGVASRIVTIKKSTILWGTNAILIGASTYFGLSLYAKISSLVGKILLCGLHSSFLRTASSPASHFNGANFSDTLSNLDNWLYTALHITVLCATGNPVMAAATPSIVSLARLAYGGERLSNRSLLGF